MASIGNFIFYNFLTILFGSIVYFFSKETVRVSKGGLSKALVTSMVSILGIFIIVLIFSGGLIYPSFKDKSNLNSFRVFLNPAFIYLIVFSVMIDKRLFFPLFAFYIFAFFIRFKGWNIFSDDLITWIPYFLFKGVLFLVVGFFVLLPLKKWLFKSDIFKTIISFTIFLIGSILIDFIQVSSILKYKNLESITTLIIWIVYVLIIFSLQMTIVFFIEKAYSNFNKLESFSVKDDVSYYRMSLSKNELRNIIDKNSIEMGIILLFNIKMKDKEKTSKCLNFIRESTNKEYSNVFYFKASNNHYGIFIPIQDNNINYDITIKGNKLLKRNDDDFLSKIESIILQTEKDFDTFIAMTGSIYGVHSYDIEELIENCKFLFAPSIIKKNVSKIVVYDFKRVKSGLKERMLVANLPIKTSEIEISFIKVISEKNIYYPSISFENKITNNIETLDEIMDPLNKDITPQEKKTILRYTAYQTIRKFDKKNSSLIIYYSQEYIGDPEFKVDKFISKINRYMNTNEIIIGLFISEEINLTFLNNIEIMRGKEIKFALINPEDVEERKLKLLKTEFAITKRENEFIFDTKKCFYDLKTNSTTLNINLV